MVIPSRPVKRLPTAVLFRIIMVLGLIVYLFTMLQVKNMVSIDNSTSPLTATDAGLEHFLSGRSVVKKGDAIRTVDDSTREKLQIKLDRYYLDHGEPFQGDLWELSDYVPEWMKEYFVWHKKEVEGLTLDNWSSKRILVAQCIKGLDTKCGGTADRLKPFVLLLREAYEMKRVLFIYWTLPARLEEFLVPPRGGIDWRAPSWLHEHIENPSLGRKIVEPEKLKSLRDNKLEFFRSRVQSLTGGAELYDAELLPNEPTFEDVYHDVWRIFFTPSIPIRTRLETQFHEMSLVPGEYAAIHIRALYGRITERSNEEAIAWAQNGINCASNFRPGGPFFFASEHTYSTRAAVTYGKRTGTNVEAIEHGKTQPLHFDRADDIQNRRPEEFYDTFLDLYLMGMSRCVIYNRGGFGTWAALIGYDPYCKKSQKTSTAGIGNVCQWTPPEKNFVPPTSSGAPLFLEEAPSEPSSTQRILEESADWLYKSLNDSSVATGFHNTLPKKLSDYLHWHQHVRGSLTEQNYDNYKYIICVCPRTQKCGGLSDRLKPLPLIVLLAARSNRMLLIHWEKPSALENWLVPPADGIDWTLPEWMPQMYRRHESNGGLLKTGQYATYGVSQGNMMNDTFLKFKVQNADAGEELYNAQPEAENTTYPEIFHELFRKFFHPAPRLAAIIGQKMLEHDLVPGKYTSMHHRDRYGERLWREPLETMKIMTNGINCASELYPGAPVYVAADLRFAVDVAREYGKQNKIPVGTLDFVEDPAHLDKDYEWRKRDPSFYDDAFVDLFLLGQAHCVAYSNGGFGHFGMLLSYNASCSIRHFQRRRSTKRCRWTFENGTSVQLPPPTIDIPVDLLVDPGLNMTKKKKKRVVRKKK